MTKSTHEYFKIKTAYANYYAEIWHQYKGIDKVYIGARKKCVSFSVYLNENGSIDEDERPQLDGFGFDKNCNSKGNHLKGIGSVHLLNTALCFIVSHYNLPEKTQFQFTDTSFIECIRYNMPLSVYYLVLHGKTWYEDKFNAEPLFTSKELFDMQKKTLKEYLSGKPDISEYFMKEQCKLFQYITEKYTNCSSLKECIYNLKKEDCYVFREWLMRLCLKFVPNIIGTSWVLKNTFPRHVIRYSKIEGKPESLFSIKGGNLFFHRHDL